MGKKLTKEEFIVRAREVHGDKYDYSQVNYVDYNKTKTCIICHDKDEDGKEHGEFYQLPCDHIAGSGCPKCGRMQRKLLNSLTKEKFIENARKVHGDKYSYDNVVYINNHTQVFITCPIHGDFPMIPNNHTSKRQGCPWCAGNKKKNNKVFIEEARTIHGDKYDYSKVNYVNNHTPVTIICPIHGEFHILPTNHIMGRQGCFYCNSSHLETETESILKQNNVDFEQQKKFTWLKSSKDWPMRLDFYLPKYNIAIECQGEQHYKARGVIFTEERVNKIKQRDTLKYELCLKHGIPIHYIKYNEKVEARINEILAELKQKENSI